ncbi:MAG: NADH-quinone oxidoreductase subunit NuoE [Ignavibacteriales bacterium]|nr:NADH-quinone oxidoreductase subunit NuoE [Ignavibacteriales bacterium]
MLNESNKQKLEELRKRYPTSQALVLPVLWMVQEQEGYISEDAMKYVAAILNVSYGHILGVVTFYTMFHSKPLGSHHIEVCTNVSCMLRGCDKIVEHLENKLGITFGETSKDKKWTLSEAECLGSCGTAPMLAIADEYYESLTPQKVDEILERLRP